MSEKKNPQSRSLALGGGLRRWMKLTESSTCSWVPGDLKQASRVFDRLLTLAEQMSVVREVVVTRAAELVRAYRNVIDVGYGFRRRRSQRLRGHQIVRTPCVRFIVKRKWAKGAEDNPEAKIPARLFAYCCVGRERRLCAVPTDVEDARAFAVPQAHAAKIKVTLNGKSAPGAIACGIKRGQVKKAYALSCRHLLSLTDVYGTEPCWGASVEVSAAGGLAYLGKTCGIVGTLQEAPRISFDAQLLEVTSLDNLCLALDKTRFLSYASGEHDLPNRVSILTPRGVVRAELFRPLSRLLGLLSGQNRIYTTPNTLF